METEQSSQHQHAQWLASLATGHFVQQSVSSAVTKGDANPMGNSQVEEDDSHIVDMSGHTVVKLATDATESPPVAPATGTPFNLRRNLKKRKIDHDEPERHEFKLIRPKERVSAKSFDMRRPVRPIDRQKMRPWLKNLLDTGAVFGLNWVEREEGVFQISWRHASRLGWNLETDGDVFERWARHTGIFKDGDEPEPKRWKANFRCALHSLPDVKELTSPTDRKGRNASRTYRFLRPNEVQPPVKRKQRYNIQIPYAVYENQASEDSGSQPADSDDRNTDEEAVVPEQIQAFPLCDHDYAIRWGKTPGEQASSEVLSRNNSGFVLIKSKESHEIEFRLTPPQTSQQSSGGGTRRVVSASKSVSPQRKGKGTKRKPPAAGSLVKKGKGKVGQKTGALKKDGKAKKMKKAGEKSDPSAATKVSLKALLSGRRNMTISKKGKAGPTAGMVTKKMKRAKKTDSPAGKAKQKTASTSGTSSPLQSQGLDALLEAANQIESMDTSTSALSTPVANSSPSRAIPKRGSRTKVVSAQPAPKSSPARSRAAPNSQLIVPNAAAAPIVLATTPAMITTRTTGAAFTPIPVMASMQAPGASSTSMTSQVSLDMFQKLLGLSTVQAIPASSVPMTLVPGQVVAAPVLSTRAEVKKPGARPADRKPPPAAAAQKSPSKKKGRMASNSAVASQKVESDAPKPEARCLVPQPEGTSMLKHLLRLTGPSMNITTTSSTTPLTIPTTSQVSLPSLGQVPTVAEVMTVKDTSEAEQTVVKVEAGNKSAESGDSRAVEPMDQSGEQNHRCVLVKQGTGSPPPAAEVDGSGVATLQVNSSHVLVTSEAMETEEAVAPVESSATVVSGVSSVSTLSNSVPVTSGLEVLQSIEGTAPCAGSSQIHAPAGVCFTQASVPAPLVTNTVPQVTLCLPQTILGPQPQQEAGDSAQKMTVTLPQASVSALQGQGGSMATFTHSIDLLQFLNLCAASGNGQVIIKTEPPPSTDMVVESNTQTSELAASSQGGGEGLGVPSYVVVGGTGQEGQSTEIAGRQPGMSDGHSEMSAVHTVSLSASPSPAFFSTSALQPTAVFGATDSAVLTATMDTCALSTAVAPSSDSSATMSLPVLSGPFHVVPASLPDSMSVSAATKEVTQGEVSQVGGQVTVSNQFVHDATLTGLSADQQGADSFIVEDMLL
ncbi:uncharacterized protein LOC143292941 [Babylonia areolata]|uniref:uncharacterized protein LOC143292941 n=1 Tax=Babylonia areolata TaxID=304850 RepID=UPI003FD573BB